MRFFLACIFMLAAACSFAQGAVFLSGVSGYEKWAELKGVSEDIRALSAFFENAGYTVEIAQDISKAQFEKRFRSFLQKNDNSESGLVVYFAGHGYTYNGEGYIVLKDAGEPKNGIGDFLSGSLPIRYLSDAAADTGADIMFIFDSCFGGGWVADSASGRVREYISSGTAEQMVPDVSVFRRKLLEGLQGYADTDRDGEITGSELGSYLQGEVSAYSGGLQTPVFGRGGEGEFVFAAASFKVEPASAGEKDALLNIIRKNPHSPDAHKALARLREIDESLSINPPVKGREKGDRVMSVKSAKYKKYNRDDYPYLVLAPVRVDIMDGKLTVIFRVKAKDDVSYQKLIERQQMLGSVVSRRLNESNLQLVDDITEIRQRARRAAKSAADWVCPGCVAEEPAIAGLAD